MCIATSSRSEMVRSFFDNKAFVVTKPWDTWAGWYVTFYATVADAMLILAPQNNLGVDHFNFSSGLVGMLLELLLLVDGWFSCLSISSDMLQVSWYSKFTVILMSNSFLWVRWVMSNQPSQNRELIFAVCLFSCLTVRWVKLIAISDLLFCPMIHSNFCFILSDSNFWFYVSLLIDPINVL